MKMNTYTCPYIILLSGTPGTGKTTISNALSKRFNRKIFQLGDYIMKNSLYTTEEDGSDAKTIDPRRAPTSSAIEILSKYLIFDVVIIDSHYADIIMDGFFEIQEKRGCECAKSYTKGINIYSIICRCHPRILERRLSKRNYSTSKINENIQAEILSESTQNMLDVLALDKIFEIDTTSVSVNEIAAVINQFLVHKIHCKEYENDLLAPVGKIDWILSLSESNELNNYFKQDYGERTEYNLEDLNEDNNPRR
jgi:adenylate kinase